MNGPVISRIQGGHMKSGHRGMLFAVALALLPGPAAAAQGLINERTLSLDVALELASAAMEACRKHGSQVTITVLDHAGRTKVVLRGDGSNPHSVEHSLRKAYTALTYRMPSGEYGKRAARSEEHTSELQSLAYLVCRLLLEKKKKKQNT